MSTPSHTSSPPRLPRRRLASSSSTGFFHFSESPRQNPSFHTVSMLTRSFLLPQWTLYPPTYLGSAAAPTSFRMSPTGSTGSNCTCPATTILSFLRNSLNSLISSGGSVSLHTQSG